VFVHLAPKSANEIVAGHDRSILQAQFVPALENHCWQVNNDLPAAMA
jgi:hypothetical protein